MIIRFKEQEYFFSIRSIIFFIIGGSILVFVIYKFLDSNFNIWIEEIVSKQTGYILNNIFNIKTQVIYHPEEDIPWTIFIPANNKTLYMSTWCTAVHVFSIYAGIIIMIPHSQESSTNNDIIWRKAKTLSLLIIIVYCLNIFRLLIVIALSYHGVPISLAHLVINYISAFIAAFLFVLFLHKYLPEIFISIYYLFCSMRNQFSS
ncbi:MAG: hypothetical protein ACFFA0_13640 [Promethearchaeota archaeon]